MSDKKIRVMVVDDAALVRLFYRDTLEKAGFIVDEALNGLEALEKVLSEAPDLLIVDVNMPQMDGITFVKTLRRQERPVAGIPVLITSTEAAPQDFAAAREAGANFYLVKPIDPDRLLAFAAMMCGVAA
ncbi:response regulator [Paraburkholderia metrosideri]|jgi:two-component system chemotaxis response regulator CheY|uniref:Chemotaxis protein CheY n=1 Tax=Paraburkholderia metrosideri TaxID=580937 RepID=A0ABN7HLI6_9BURK|nr:response regulator [Paraburkholderia metrosideri]CAD6526124.1 Chemotaxis protein CheY [Paraburkholderia metrosideri]